MILNLGCGYNQKDGQVNVDAVAACKPDVVFDLETFPWPWGDNEVDGVVLHHSLEHMCGDIKVFCKFMQELYRVVKVGGEVVIVVPHPRHDDFINGPDHVRIITPQLMQLFDRKECDRWVGLGASNTPFAHYLDVDFRIIEMEAVLDAFYSNQLKAGLTTLPELDKKSREANNIFKEYRMKLRVHKGEESWL